MAATLGGQPAGADNTAIDTGDFVDSDDECDVEDASEPPERYSEGLYYPVCIGEVLANRYYIQHKLGHGGFSTVWMAHDLVSKQDLALKIMKPGDSGEHEYWAHNRIIMAVQDTTHLLTYQDTFFLDGSHGRHRVLVLPLQGPNLRDYAWRTPVAARMSAARQLLEGLKSLHDGGIIHRDLNSANVMYSLGAVDVCKATTNTTAKYKYLGRPRKIHLPLADPLWKAGELVAPMDPVEDLVRNRISLGDFGLAVEAGTSVVQRVQSPVIYCAPERLHGANPSFATDMWSYMCIFAELYLGSELFRGRAGTSVMTFMVNTLGPLPASWKGLYDGGGVCDDSWYNEERKGEEVLALENKVARIRSDIGVAERQLVISVLQRGLSYIPEERMSARQLLEDKSFKAILGIYSV